MIFILLFIFISNSFASIDIKKEDNNYSFPDAPYKDRPFFILGTVEEPILFTPTYSIEEFKNIENILANRGTIKQDNIRLTLELFEYDLLNNFKLCQIIEADETPISLKNLLYQKDQRSTKEILITM